MVATVKNSYSYLQALSPAPAAAKPAAQGEKDAPTLGEMLDSIRISPEALLLQSLYPDTSSSFDPIATLFGGSGNGQASFFGYSTSGTALSPILASAYASLMTKATQAAPEKIEAAVTVPPMQVILNKYQAVLNTDYSKPLTFETA